MKNLYNALKRGDLKAKERVLLLVHDAVKKETTGKGILTEAEKHAVSESWTPANNEEVKEYNRYMQGWRLTGMAELDAQTTYLNAEVNFFESRQVLTYLTYYPHIRAIKGYVERLDDIKIVTVDEAVEIAKKQREVKLKEGMEYDRAVYYLAFESLSKTAQDDFIKLFPDIRTEMDYLDEQETLYNLLNGKRELTDKDKEKIADLIVKRAYNGFAKEYQLFHYYADIPLREIGLAWLTKRDIQPETPTDPMDNTALDFMRQKTGEARGAEVSKEQALREFTAEQIHETIKEYASKHSTTIEAELREITLELLNDGLLEKHQPLFKSTGLETVNGEDTATPHDELFKLWLETKGKAKKTVDEFIKAGKLVKDGDTITGDSLYSFTGGYEFIKDFKEYVDRYDANLGIVDDPEREGWHLDRDLLITDKSFLSFSKIAIEGIKAHLEAISLIKEAEDNGERILEFDAENLNKLASGSLERLKENYATLLSFRDLFNRLSKTYGIDLTYKINDWITTVEGFIDSNNEVVAGVTQKSHKEAFKKVTIRLKDDLTIDKEAIKPNNERTGSYLREFEETLKENF